MLSGTTNMRKRLRGASLSKWPAALAIAGLVADGRLSRERPGGKMMVSVAELLVS